MTVNKEIGDKSPLNDVIVWFSDLAFRLYRILGRIYIKFSGNPRPSSYPYITGDGFRNAADHVYDKVRTFNPKDVKEKDVVFVGDSTIKKFLHEIHPHIQVAYILVTHNGDAVVDNEVFALAQDKVLKWYGINMLVSSPKAVPLPLGIENKYFYVLGIPSIFNKVIKKNIAKKNRIFYAFTTANNKEERQPALDALRRNRFAETLTKWLNFYGYLHLLATYKFVASPPGSCVEGHRTWDTLYIGGVPIVKSSVTTHYFKKIGIPVYVVDTWDQLDSLTEQSLEEMYTALTKNADRSLLYMDYWLDKIKNMKD